MEQKEIPNYSEVKPKIEQIFPDTEKIQLVTILNKPLIIYDFKALPSSLAIGREFVVILADCEGRRVSFSSGEIVLKQLNEIKEKLPVKTIITREKGKRYYTLK